MSILGNPILTAALLSGSTFTPAALFAGGEQGVWYDPTDLTTMFQDAAGTTPVTAVEQPVGLIRDKSGRGNHASQSTAASRPVLSARVNLLTQTETLSDWNQSTVTLTTGISDPGGGTTAVTIAATGASSFARKSVTTTIGAGYTGNIWVRRRTGTGAVFIYLGEGASNQSITVSLTTSWQLFTTTVTSTTGAGNYGILLSTSGDAVDVWHPDFRATNDGVSLPAYQRVVTGTTADYDTTGFPLYLRFDGVDDSLATGAVTINQPATAHVGARVTNTTTTLQRFFDGVSGSRMLIGKQSATQSIVYANGVGVTFNDSFGTGVYTGTFNGVSSVARLNAVQVGSGDAGTSGVTGIRIGASNASSEFLAGRIYSLIVRGALSDATQIANAEKWVNARTGAY